MPPRLLARRLVAFALPVLLSTCAAESTETTDSVSQAIEQLQLYASPTGSGTACTYSAPCTLETAKSLVPNSVSSRDVTVTLASGTYHLTDPLVFRAADSSPTHKVTYTADPGATRPVISGALSSPGPNGTRVPYPFSWTLWDASKNIWRALIPFGTNTRSLYVNGQRATRARELFSASSQAHTVRGWTVTGSRVSGLYGLTRTNQPEVVGSNLWKTFRCPVAMLEEIGGMSELRMSTDCLTRTRNEAGNDDLTLPEFSDLKDVTWEGNWPYFDTFDWIENAYSLLNEPGEWFINSNIGNYTGALYYIPRAGESMSSAVVDLPILDQLIKSYTGRSNTDAETVAEDAAVHQNLTFRGLEFSYTTWVRDTTRFGTPITLPPSSEYGYFEAQGGFRGGQWRTPGAVSFRNPHGLRFERNVFTHLGAVGLDLDAVAQGNTVVGNVFRDISGTAIQLGDIHNLTNDPSFKNSNNVINDNFITDAAVEYRSQVGIFMGIHNNTRVFNNELAHLPYTGISSGWGWDEGSGAATTYWGNNKIIWNYIHDVMESLNDGAAVYAVETQTGSQIRNNYLRAIDHGRPIQDGVYLDENAKGFTVDGNVIDEARNWLRLHGDYVSSNNITTNSVSRDTVGCFASDFVSTSDCNPRENTVVTPIVYLTLNSLSQAILQVVYHAGLEPAYADIKTCSTIPVTWTSASGVAVSTNTLTKTSGTTGWDAGAASPQVLASGDGYVQFLAAGLTLRMLGLSHGNSDQDFADIDFALYAADGGLQVWENLNYVGYFGSYANGDVLRVAVESGKVTYAKNGKVFYTSLIPPTYPLLVDTSLYSPGAILSDVRISPNFSTPVTWTSPAGVLVSENTLTKIASTANWDAAAVSTQELSTGDGAVEFTAAGPTNTLRMLGLSHGNSDQDFADIDFSLYAANGALQVWENLNLIGYFDSYANGDVLRVAVESGKVTYAKNGKVFYTSLIPPTYPLLVDTSLYSPGAILSDVKVSGNFGNSCSAVCGNRITEGGEQCDDGNGTNSDGCDNNCTFPRCGNSILDSGEQCDDSNNVNGDYCEANCTTTVRCGNAIVDPGEQCDDGDGTNSDGCDNTCTFSTCIPHPPFPCPEPS